MISHRESKISIPDQWEALFHEVSWGAWLLPSYGSTIFNVWLPNWQGEVADVLFIAHGVLCMAGVNVSDLERANITSTNIPLSRTQSCDHR